jgi:hypothetical protein
MRGELQPPIRESKHKQAQMKIGDRAHVIVLPRIDGELEGFHEVAILTIWG